MGGRVGGRGGYGWRGLGEDDARVMRGWSEVGAMVE